MKTSLYIIFIIVTSSKILIFVLMLLKMAAISFFVNLLIAILLCSVFIFNYSVEKYNKYFKLIINGHIIIFSLVNTLLYFLFLKIFIKDFNIQELSRWNIIIFWISLFSVNALLVQISKAFGENFIKDKKVTGEMDKIEYNMNLSIGMVSGSLNSAMTWTFWIQIIFLIYPPISSLFL